MKFRDLKNGDTFTFRQTSRETGVGLKVAPDKVFILSGYFTMSVQDFEIDEEVVCKNGRVGSIGDGVAYQY